MKTLYFTLPFLFLNLVACEKVAVFMAPSKKPTPSQSKTATNAENYFWSILHKGNYQDIARAEKYLMAAYLKNPNDPKLAADMGFLHIWKVTERQRHASKNPLISEEIILSKYYFADAHALKPNDAIYESFLGDTQLISGTIFNDKREQTQGYFTLKDAIRKWPQFSYFPAGYPMTNLSRDSKQFKKALEWQWKTMDICAGKKINRKAPYFSVNTVKKPDARKQQACLDTWAAPHNLEGFFLNMGDMLVKSGDWQTGVAIYKNARNIPNYSFWPYRHMLEKRIINAKENVKYFQSTYNEQKSTLNPDRNILFNSGYGCVACHQR